MTHSLISKPLRLVNLAFARQRKFQNFHHHQFHVWHRHLQRSFCVQHKNKNTNTAPPLSRDSDSDGHGGGDSMDIDAWKEEMMNDFESEKEQLQTNMRRDHIEIFDLKYDDDDDDEDDDIDSDEHDKKEKEKEKADENEKLSFAVQQFRKNIEFNQSLKLVSRVNAIKAVKYSSSTLAAGVPELIYDADGHDQWVVYLRLYTYTPLTMGCFFVPFLIFSYNEMELFSKLMIGAFYLSSSALFPYFSYRAVKHKINRVWITPDCNQIVFEKKDFFFQPYKKEYFIKDLKLLYKRGNDRHCWFQCQRSKDMFLLVSELMTHPVWLQILGADPDQAVDAMMRNIANDGKVTMFR